MLTPHPVHLLKLAAGVSLLGQQTIVVATEVALRVTTYLSYSGLYTVALDHELRP
jgi:hypothetical protein